MSVHRPDDTQAIVRELAAGLESLPKDVAPTILLELAQYPNLTHAAAIEFLKARLSRCDSSSRVSEEVNAHDISRAQIVEIFNLDYDIHSMASMWSLLDDSLVDVPKDLQTILQDIAIASYGEDTEASCRMAIVTILIQCRKHIHRKYQIPTPSYKAKSSLKNSANPCTPLKKTDALPGGIPNKPFRLFSEATISVEIENESGRFLVRGRADWGLGYEPTGSEGALLSAIEVKKYPEFSKGEFQLVAYLAILRENRKRANKINSITQGFYSDGLRFAFVHITEDGIVKSSEIFDVRTPKGLKYIFSFIVSITETAMKSTPTTTPTEPGLQRYREVSEPRDEVWTKICALIDESVLCSF